MPNKTDWLHDCLKDWAAWFVEGFIDSDAWPEETTLYRAMQGQINLPPGSKPPPGVEKPRGLAHLCQAMNECMDDKDLARGVAAARYYYVALHKHGTSKKAVYEARIAMEVKTDSTLWHLKKQGEIAIKARMAA